MDDSGSTQAHGGHLGIYKYGQGYWVRVMTAVAMGIFFLSATGWAWRHLEAVGLPKSAWVLQLSQPRGEAQPGQTVELIQTDNTGELVLGTGTVASYSSRTNYFSVTLRDVKMVSSTRSAAEAKAVRVKGEGQPFAAGVIIASGVDIFPKVYLQAGVAGAIVLLGCIMIYWFVGSSPKSAEFLIATDGEMKKVNWSTKKIIKDSTSVVIFATFMIAALIFLFDTLLQLLMRAINVLPD